MDTRAFRDLFYALLRNDCRECKKGYKWKVCTPCEDKIYRTTKKIFDFLVRERIIKG